MGSSVRILCVVWVLAGAIPAPGQESPFVRGDSNADGAVDLSDPVFTLSYLFLRGSSPACLDASDATDDGEVNISDPIWTLSELFQGGRPAPPPGPGCGPDPTEDDLDCVSFGPCEAVETPRLAITELMAINGTTLRDGDGRYSDWIEVTNLGDASVSLVGYWLTDDLDDRMKWPFHAGADVLLDPGESIVVFASGQETHDHVDRSGYLHTSFRLDGDGEALALVAPDGETVLSSFGTGFPEQRRDVSYGTVEDAVVPKSLVAVGAPARILVGDSPVPGWTDVEFDDATWKEGTVGVGYETREQGLFTGKFETDLRGDLLGQGSSVRVRVPFEVAEPASIRSLVLWMRYDDGFVAHLNGEEVARDNAPDSPTVPPRALVDRDDRGAVAEYTRVDLSEHAARLRVGRNVLAIHALNDDPASERFLLTPALEALVEGSAQVYFPDPTPGEPNGVGLAGIVGDTEFNVDRGFYDEPQEVAITSDTPGVTIRYTTDGSPPSSSRGDLYDGPLRIETTTVLRAAAFRDTFLPTNVDTQTYLFLSDVVRQPFQAPGYPSSWAGVPSDYGMDPEVVDHPAYRDEIVDDLKSIATLSIVLNRDDMFGSSGLYPNSTQRGLAWERPASMELFTADGGESVQEEAGIRIHGGAGRQPEHPKNSFRLIFRNRYGAGKLRHDLFRGQPYGGRASREFDKLVLRAGFNNTIPHWYTEQVARAQYARDQWARDLQLEMGHPSPRGRYVHLYINGLYWGLYNVVERPDEDWGASYFGGVEEDYDVVKNGNVAAGNVAVWSRVHSLLSGGLSDADYEELLRLVDLDELVDFMLENIWFGNTDWDHNNVVSLRRRDDTGLFHFPVWDAEFAISLFPGKQANDWPSILAIDRSRVNNPGAPSAIFQALRGHADGRLRVADRIHARLFHGGTLTPSRAAELWMRRAAEVHGPIVAESARWGDYRRDVYSGREAQRNFPLFTRDEHYLAHQRWILEEYFPRRTDIVIQQLRASGLWPDAEMPELSHYGGEVEAGFELEISAERGVLYYTTDGTDPRLPGGGVSARARIAGDASFTHLMEATGPVRLLVPADGALGLSWTEPDFEDALWTAGSGPVGYDRNDLYHTVLGTDLEAQMAGTSPSVYLRIPFEGPETDAFDFLTVRVMYDDGFVAYLNGAPVASRNAPDDPSWDSTATTGHPDSQALAFEDFDVTGHRALLRPEGNVLALHGMNRRVDESDMLLGAVLATSSIARGTVSIPFTRSVKARILEDGEWSPLAQAVFRVDPGIRIRELMYHPLPPSPAEREAGFDDAELFEFIELENTGARPAPLDGWALVAGVELALDGIGLEPGERAVLVSDRRAFDARYGEAGAFAVAEYEGNLSNAGEAVVLVNDLGLSVVELLYDDAWYPSTDGEGRSLVLIDLAAGADLGVPESWTPSRDLHGSPGRGE